MKRDYDEEYYEDEEYEKKPKVGWMQSFQNLLGKNDSEEEEYYEDDENPTYKTSVKSQPKRVVSVWHDVKSMEDAKLVVDGLRKGEEQIVNFETSTPEVENDIRYFLYGAVCALDASVDAISKGVIILAPKGMLIDKPDTKSKKTNSFRVGAFRVNE